MEYTPLTAVWELTMGCNMRCGHCGSACATPLPDELTTEEALDVCDQMKTLGLKWITLSGGEPLTRKDWPIIAARLSRNGIIPNIITNGWLVDDTMVSTAANCGVATISISLDGIRDTHDTIRTKGAYDRVIQAFQILRRHGHTSAANTTVTLQNIAELSAIESILIENRVDLWQIQIGLPMGNLREQRDKIVPPEAIDQLLEFAYRTTLKGQIKVFPADCLGYYTAIEGLTRQLSIGTATPVSWQGCNAGKRSFGLLHNGDVLGCTSIRDKQFIEGNIRHKSLSEIWNDTQAFSWARNMKKSDLQGLCQTCSYGDNCLGGCPNTRLTVNGSIYSENRHCSYNLAQLHVKERLAKYNEVPVLLATARSYAASQKWQLAEMTLTRALELEGDNIDVLELHGYVCFQLGDYLSAKKANEKILQKNAHNAYGLKGLGLSLHRLNDSEQGVAQLRKAVELSTPQDMDAFYDLFIVYNELGRAKDAQELLSQAEAMSPGFITRMSTPQVTLGL